MTSEQQNNYYPRGNVPRHSAVLEEIHEEEQDSIPEEDETNLEKPSHSENDFKRKNAIRSEETPEISPEIQRIEDPLASSDEEENEKPFARSISVSNADLEERHRLDSIPENDRSQQSRYTRHSSIDKGILKPQNNSEDVVEKYYERNNYTVTGRDRPDFYNKLPGRLQHRLSVHTDAASRFSSPGAMGEPVVPTLRRFDKSMYWFAFHRKQIGFRHFSVVILVLLYTLLGAVMFWTVESRHEKAKTLDHVNNLEHLLDRLAENITESVNNINTTTTEEEMKVYIREAYIELMKLEGQYKGSTYYKLEADDNWKWTFESAFFFSMNVYTTTGYGSIAPESTLGQVLVCVYGFIFVPVTLVVLRDLGQFFLVHLTKLYAHGIQKFRELNGNKHVDEDEIISLPIKACLLLLASYLGACTIFIYFYDELSGPEPGTGMDMFLCFYFSFISLSTIGLGDIMPNNATFAPIISIIFFFGMAVTKVVNRNTFIAVENGIFGAFTLVENKLDAIVTRSSASVKPEDRPSTPKVQRALSVDAGSEVQDETPNEILNNLTVRSIATFMKSNADIYGGGFGRVQLRRGDLIHSDSQNQMTVNSMSQLRHRTASQSQPNQATGGNNNV
ncbi:Potassium channel domain-containing protein [Caenorhabditis elegans]|uniref:Potassium channel domain-containing protein n=1 Tax=Caenorhabditis elegans TaxID=6239 RepID=O45894_CAEEL|nr:Potassium channel domain-containing protein [Caenorhabditis elegans]CAB04926.2 Potassium channel domain-containing protein [Caenorhabditis elegans]|eukprot:NP_001309463.1 TWiK family of potassium channels [Caenorhabditis elegans]